MKIRLDNLFLCNTVELISSCTYTQYWGSICQTGLAHEVLLRVVDMSLDSCGTASRNFCRYIGRLFLNFLEVILCTVFLLFWFETLTDKMSW